MMQGPALNQAAPAFCFLIRGQSTIFRKFGVRAHFQEIDSSYGLAVFVQKSALLLGECAHQHRDLIEKHFPKSALTPNLVKIVL
jgi:hypothetical protein